MKKSDIISEYNSLTGVLDDILVKYKEVTGNDWNGTVRTGKLFSNSASMYKEDLERILRERMNNINTIEEGIEIWKRTECLKSTEDGRNFIRDYENRKIELENRIDEIAENLAGTFNDVLKDAGMGYWKVSGGKITPERSYEYFNIEMDRRISLSISVDLKRDYLMEVSSSIHCGGGKGIEIRDENFWQFKGYVMMHENHEKFNMWVNTKFRDANHEIVEIRNEIDGIEKVLEDPMHEYAMKKMESERKDS